LKHCIDCNRSFDWKDHGSTKKFDSVERCPDCQNTYEIKHPMTPGAREKAEERRSKEFWLNDDGRVVKALGWECNKGEDGYWWFPTLGYSASRVFNDEESAKKEAILECETNIQSWMKKLAALKGK